MIIDLHYLHTTRLTPTWVVVISKSPLSILPSQLARCAYVEEVLEVVVKQVREKEKVIIVLGS